MTETPTEQRPMSPSEMADWQRICYGDTDAARAALAYYRERGWPVDAETFPERDRCEDLIYHFMAGYEAAQSRQPTDAQKIEALQAALDSGRADERNMDTAAAFWDDAMRLLGIDPEATS